MAKPSRESVPFEVKAAPMIPMIPTQISEADRIVKAIYAVCGNVDLGNDRIMNGAFSKTIGDRLASGNIKVLWQHDLGMPAIATPLMLKELTDADMPSALVAACPDATGALYGEVQYLDTPRANEVLAGIRGKAITQNSIGFDVMRCSYEAPDGGAMQMDGMGPMMMGDAIRNIEEVRLWDISPVNFGMNPETLNMKIFIKAAIPYKKTAVNADASWDAGAMMGNCDGSGAQLETQMKSMCAWIDPEADPATKAAYKFPHHMVNGSGAVGAANLKACQSGIAVLNGGMGGASIPDGDRQAVYNHLAHHIRDAGVEPPELKDLSGPDGLQHQLWTFVNWWERNEAELKRGRVLSGVNADKITAAMDHMMTAHGHLNDVMQAAEPSDSGKTLTDAERANQIAHLMADIAIRERELAFFE